ncbi:1,3-propanediol dehydrogenase [subsurface metagenome]
MKYSTMIAFQAPTKITFGPAVISKLGNLVKDYSKRIMVLSMKDIPSLPDILRLLEKNGAEVCLFDEIPPNPLDSTVDETAKIARKSGCELIVGLGGGSSIDAAKATAVLATHEGKAWEYTVEMGKDKRPINQKILPVIAIPTTAGTGAEVTMNAILTNPVTKQKSPVQSTRICPAHALVDPELTVTMPSKVTAATGFDAFTHAFERFLCADSFPFIDSMAFVAMKIVVNNLGEVLDEPENIELRSAMSWAATQAGLTLLATSMGESGLHVFSLPISAHFQIPHGEAVALSMPIALPELCKIRPQKAAKLARLFSEEVPQSEKEACDFAVHKMDEWLCEISLKRKLSDYGIKESDIPKLAKSLNIDRIQRAWEREMSYQEVETYYKKNL